MSTITTTKSLFDLSKSAIERMKKEELIALLEAEGFKGVPTDIKRPDLTAFAFECIAFRKEVAEAEVADLEKFGPETEEDFVAEVETRAELVYMVDAFVAQEAADENQALVEAKIQIDDTPIDFETLYINRLIELTNESVENIAKSAKEYMDLGVAGTMTIALQMMIEDIEAESHQEPQAETKFPTTFTRQGIRALSLEDLTDLAKTHNIAFENRKREDLRQDLVNQLCPTVSKDAIQEYTDRLSAESKSALCREMHDKGYRPIQIQISLSMHPSHVQSVLAKHRKTTTK